MLTCIGIVLIPCFRAAHPDTYSSLDKSHVFDTDRVNYFLLGARLELLMPFGIEKD